MLCSYNSSICSSQCKYVTWVIIVDIPVDKSWSTDSNQRKRTSMVVDLLGTLSDRERNGKVGCDSPGGKYARIFAFGDIANVYGKNSVGEPGCDRCVYGGIVLGRITDQNEAKVGIRHNDLFNLVLFVTVIAGRSQCRNQTAVFFQYHRTERHIVFAKNQREERVKVPMTGRNVKNRIGIGTGETSGKGLVKIAGTVKEFARGSVFDDRVVEKLRFLGDVRNEDGVIDIGDDAV